MQQEELRTRLHRRCVKLNLHFRSTVIWLLQTIALPEHHEKILVGNGGVGESTCMWGRGEGRKEGREERKGGRKRREGESGRGGRGEEGEERGRGEGEG